MEGLGAAKYIIDECNDRDIHISNMKLQKLLYYAQGIHLAEYGEPLFEEEIYAWDYGPVVPIVYRTFSAYGASNISSTKTLRYDFRTDRKRRIIAECSNEKADKTASQVLDYVIERLAGLSAIQLMRMTHNEAPWVDVYESGRSNIIEKDDIQNYFMGE